MQSLMTKLKTNLAISGLLLVAMTVPISLFSSPGFSKSPELSVVGQVDDFVVGPGQITDVWAYGNYAYLGSFDEPECSLDFTGVHIVDISDPTAPVRVKFIPAKPGTRNNDVKVEHIETPFFSGEILVVSNEPCGSVFHPRQQSRGGVIIPGQDGVSIWDVTDPTQPKVLKQNFLSFGVHNTFIYQQGNRAYMLVVDDNNVQDVHIVDLTKPQSPKEIAVTGQLDWPTDLDNIGVGEVFLHDVWVQQNTGQVIAYLSYWDAGLVLLDITDPTNPVFLGDSDYLNPDPLSGEAPEGNSHVAVPNADGTRVLMGDEDFAAGALTAFTFDGTPYPAAEGAFTVPVYTLPGGAFSGPVVWTGGEGCTPAEIPPAPATGDIALIQRGRCFFQDKAESAFAQGYAGFIVANDAARGDTLVTMAPRDQGPYPPIPGVFVGFSTGEVMKAAGVGNLGGTVVMTGVFDGYGYLRLLDVSNPSNIVELDQFATEGVFVNPPLAGDRTMHNVVVDGTNAYISWYAEGIRVVSFKNDRFKEKAHFVADDGSNFWGVYLHRHPNGNTYILGSDRDSGLWIFQAPGSPTAPPLRLATDTHLKASLLNLSTPEVGVPKVTRLNLAYPSPANPDVWFPYHLSAASLVVIDIYGSTGRLVRTLDLGHKPAGFYDSKSKSAHWDGRNHTGEAMPSGIYFYTLKAGDFTGTRKLLIVR